MVDEVSKLNVEVDGTRAATDVDKISAAFKRLEASAARAGAQFRKMGAASSSAFTKMRSAGSKAFGALGKGFRSVQKLAGTFTRAFRFAFKAIAIGTGIFALFVRSVVDAGNTINKFINTLVILKGGTADAIKELQELFVLANKLGTSFTAAAAPFTKFAAAAAGSLSDQGIRDVFESFATVGVALQLTQSEVTGVFLALQQIASKGVVSMEELRLQLAERVPGAMRLAASAMGMTMRDFEQAVRDRTINAGEFLEKFAAKLKQTFGVAAGVASERLFADINRLTNAFVAFRQKIFQSGFEKGIQNLVRSAANFLNNNSALATALGRFSESIFDKVAAFLDSLNSDRVINIINQIISVFELLINVLNRVAFELRKIFDDEFNAAVELVQTQSVTLNNLIRQRNELAEDLEAGQVRTDVNTFGLTGVFEMTSPISDEQRQVNEAALQSLNDDLVIARGNLEETTEAIRNMGVAVDELPKQITDLVGTIEVGPLKIVISRVEPEDPTEGLEISSGVVVAKGLTGAQSDALEQAERFATIKLPDFYEKLISDELRAGMEDVARINLDLNTLLVDQAEVMERIRNVEVQLQVLRSGNDINANATKLNDATRTLNQLTTTAIANEDKRRALKEDLLKALEKENSLLDSQQTFQQALETTFTSTQDVFINSIKKTEDAITSLVTTGKASFTDLANSIIADLTRMAIQAFITRFILGPILGGLSDALGGALGGSFQTPSTVPGAKTSTNRIHKGGVSGMGRLAFGKDDTFENLRSNEQPIIVERGEGIFTKDQMKDLTPVSSIMSSLSTTLSKFTPEKSSGDFTESSKSSINIPQLAQADFNKEQMDSLAPLPSLRPIVSKLDTVSTQTRAHSGGISGEEELAFASGKFPGLRSNEQPIIVERGEGIFTASQMKSLAPAQSNMNIAPPTGAPISISPTPVNIQIPSTKVEVINNTSEEARIETDTTGDGSELIRVVIGAVAADIGGDGTISKVLKGKFGLKNTTGIR